MKKKQKPTPFEIGKTARAKCFTNTDEKGLEGYDLKIVKKLDKHVWIESSDGSTHRFTVAVAEKYEWAKADPCYMIVPTEHKSVIGDRSGNIA